MCYKATTLGIRRPEFLSQLYGLGVVFTAVAPLSSPVREGVSLEGCEQMPKRWLS